MSIEYYVGNAGSIAVEVTDNEGTPVTPQSATATVINTHTNEAVALNEACLVEEGLVSWIMPAGHAASQNAGRYMAFITVVVDSTTINTAAVPFDVLDKSSHLAADRWRRKVEHAAPNRDAITDQEARDWVDQAVGMLASDHDFEYTSTLGTISPTPDSATIEKIASVAALMARTAWWAGKGNWRDEEMSFDGTPFENEWNRLLTSLTGSGVSDWLTGDIPTRQYDMYNRDKTDRWGNVDEPDDLYDQRWLRDSSN